MTTGRINQVTIFAAVALAGSGLPRGGVELVKGRGKTPGLKPAARTESGPRASDHPFATTEFSKARSVKEALGIPTDFDIPTSEGGYPSPVTSRRTDTGTQAYPQMRRRIDCHRPTIHGLLRRGTVGNQPSRLRVPRRSHWRVAIATASSSNPSGHSPNASPVATALVAVSVGKGQSFSIADKGREGEDKPLDGCIIKGVSTREPSHPTRAVNKHWRFPLFRVPDHQRCFTY